MTSLRSGLAVALIALVAATGPAAAQQVQNLGTFKNWTAWKTADANGEVCYVSSAPQTTAPEGVRRSPIHFIVLYRQRVPVPSKPGEFAEMVNEVQSVFGYPLRDAPNPSANIDGRDYTMMPEGEAAWLASMADESSFVDAMKAGTRLIVKGQSLRGTDTTDTYDLGGVTAAMDEVRKNCTWI
jgi:hypothetical protein